MTVMPLLAAVPARADLVKQPWLQNLTDSSVVVMWQTDSATAGLVQFGPDTTYGSEVAHLDPATVHECTLFSLTRDTVYHYRTLAAGDTSADNTLHTPVETGGWFRFLASGDNRTQHDRHREVVDRMELVDNPGPGLLLNVGDLTYSGAADEYDTFFAIEQRLLGRAALSPVIGTHEMPNLPNWYTLFCLPNNERWYTVRYGNSVFHGLDTESPVDSGSEQYHWFLDELQADRWTQREDIPLGTGRPVKAGGALAAGGLLYSLKGNATNEFNLYGLPDSGAFAPGATQGINAAARPGLSIRPNPAAGPVRVEFDLPEPGGYLLRLYDATGRLAAGPGASRSQAGRTGIELNTRQLPHGVYLLRLAAAGTTVTERLVVRYRGSSGPAPTPARDSSQPAGPTPPRPPPAPRVTSSFWRNRLVLAMGKCTD